MWQPDQQAGVNWVVKKKTAIIKILDSKDYLLDSGPNCLYPQDMEQSLVHELLHLHFAAIDDYEGLKDIVHEQAIDQIAKSLIKVKRKVVT